MEGHVMVNFLPTILNQLFCVLTRATHEDVAVNVTRQATSAKSRMQWHTFTSLLTVCTQRKLQLQQFFFRRIVSYFSFSEGLWSMWSPSATRRGLSIT